MNLTQVRDCRNFMHQSSRYYECDIDSILDNTQNTLWVKLNCISIFSRDTLLVYLQIKTRKYFGKLQYFVDMAKQRVLE